MRKNIFLAVTILLNLCVYAQTSDTITLSETLPEIVATVRVVQPTDNHETLSATNLNKQNTGVNLPYLLTSTPSLVVTSDDGLGIGYTYFRIRGTDHTRINMTVNDVPLNDSESQTVFWVNTTDMASNMNRVDVQRGVGTSTNGAASFGASINMNTEDFGTLQKSSAELSFNGGMYNTFREMAKVNVILPNNFRINARFSKVNSNGYLERAFSDLYSYYTSAGYYDKQTIIKLTTFGGSERTYMAWDGIDAETLKTNRRYNPAGEYTDENGNTAFYNNQTDNYKQQHYQLHARHRFTENWLLSGTLHYTHGMGYYEQYKADKKFSEYGMKSYINNSGTTVKRSDFIRRKNLYNHFYGGIIALNYSKEHLETSLGGAINKYVGNHYGQVIWMRDSLYPYALPKDYEYYRNQGDKLDANVYLKANWKIIDKQNEFLNLYGDLQYRHVNYQINGINDEDLAPIPVHEIFNFFNPKAGITYFKNHHHVYASFAIANREPSRKNYTEAGANDIPTSERLYDYEIGYNYTNHRVNAGANIYVMDYDNQLVLTGKYSDTGAYLTQNVKNSYRTGIELTLGIEIAKWLTWNGNLTLSRNKIINYTDWVDIYDSTWEWLRQDETSFGTVDIAFSPNITAGSNVLFNIAGFNATLQTNFVGKQYLDNTMSEEAKLKPYCVSNLHLAYILPLNDRCPKITILTQLNNLFNSMYSSNGGNWMCRFEDGSYSYSPWFYAQARFNIHAGFTIVL